jgi:hypothetical protein
VKEEHTNNILERCWADLKSSINQHGVLSPLQLVAELEKYDRVKIDEFQRRLLGTIRTPKGNRSKKTNGKFVIISIMTIRAEIINFNVQNFIIVTEQSIPLCKEGKEKCFLIPLILEELISKFKH